VDIPRVAAPSAEVFEAEYLRPGRPVVLTGLLERWRSWGQWSIDWFDGLYGHQVLSANNSIPGRQDVRVGDYLAALRAGDTAGLYLDAMPLAWLPGMAEVIVTPPYCPNDRETQVLVWVGPGGTCLDFHKDNHTPLDGNQNLLAQLVGKKRIVLASPTEDARMYPEPQKQHDYLRSEVKLDRWRREEHPLFAEVTLHETVVGPGDVLFIPAHWWHYVRSLETSMTVTFWWRSSRLIELLRQFGEAARQGAAEPFLSRHEASVGAREVEELGGPEAFKQLWDPLPPRVRALCVRMLAHELRD